MKYLSLYRKYRPQVFEEIVEQDCIVKILRTQVINNSISHAYLFTGTRGTGKTTLARIFARAINCENPKNGSPCLECATCKALSEPNGDIYELDAASNNGIDNIRDIKESVQYQPLVSKYKVYIIDEVHQLSPQAFNAFLKTLEEPPEYCVFILATTEPQKLPQTILSRCLKLDFRLVSNDGLCSHLSKILTDYNIKFTPEGVDLIAEAGEGSVRDSLSILEACISASSDLIDYNLVLDVLGSNNPDFILDTCNAILNGDINLALNQIDYASGRGKNMPVLFKDILKSFRDLLIIKNNSNADKFLKLPIAIFEKAKKIALSFGSSEILRCLEIFTEIDASIKFSTTPRYVLETAVAKCVCVTANDFQSQVARLEAVERKISDGITVTKYVKEIEVRNGSVQEPQRIQDEGKEIMSEVSDLPFDIGTVQTMPEEIKTEVQSKPVELDKPEKTDSKPNAKTISRAKAQQIKTAVLKALGERKLVILQTVFSDNQTYIAVNNNNVNIFVKSEFDMKMITDQIELIKSTINNALQIECNVYVKISDNKNKDDDFVGQFSANKVKFM